jgi:AbrB family looped-hinge helix DNA binding protein
MSYNYGILVDDRGRIVLPASVRKALEVRSGDRLILTVEPEGDMRLVSMRKQVERCEGLFATLAGLAGLPPRNW